MNEESSATNSTSRSRTTRVWAAIVAATVAGLVGYSCYVALHEPEPQETILLGQSRLAPGSPASWRLLVRNRTNGKPIAKAWIALTLRNEQGLTSLGSYITGGDGTIDGSVMIPDVAPGDGTLVVDVRSRLGYDHIERKVTIANPTQILLTTDKPLYQPGQTIHLRALVCNSRTRQPCSWRPVSFEISDGKGNKVFKEAAAS